MGRRDYCVSLGGATIFNRFRLYLLNYIKRLSIALHYIPVKLKEALSLTLNRINYICNSIEESIYEYYSRFVRSFIRFQSYLENSLSLLSFFMVILMIVSLLMVIIVWIGIT